MPRPFVDPVYCLDDPYTPEYVLMEAWLDGRRVSIPANLRPPHVIDERGTQYVQSGKGPDGLWIYRP
jgi:hypothetical protein